MSNDLLNDSIQMEEPMPEDTDTEAEKQLTRDVYNVIKDRLVAKGIPAEKIAFIHDCKSPAERQALFRRVNEGSIRVLLGSTEKMGTGVNAQERAIAIHQVTPPWRPADLEQQLGRVWRQGNLYPEVFQFVYVMEGSFDAYIWQKLENKATFIGQVARGVVSTRKMEDINENVLSFSEIKAMASGNPAVMEKIMLDTEIARLAAVRRTWKSTITSADAALVSLRTRRVNLEEVLRDYMGAVAQRDEWVAKRQVEFDQQREIKVKDLQEQIDHEEDKEKKKTLKEELARVKEDRFLIQLGADIRVAELIDIVDREKAGKHLRLLFESIAVNLGVETRIPIGFFKGFQLIAYVSKAIGSYLPHLYFKAGKTEVSIGIADSDIGITLSLDSRVRGLDEDVVQVQKNIVLTDSKIKSLEDEVGKPWDQEAKYQSMLKKAAELEAQLGTTDKKDEKDKEKKRHTQQFADTTAEVNAALDHMAAMHADPQVLSRFDIVVPVPAEELIPVDITTPEPIEISQEEMARLEAEVQQKQALVEFGKALLKQGFAGDRSVEQFDIFTEVEITDWKTWKAAKIPNAQGTKRKSRKVNTHVQQGLLF